MLRFPGVSSGQGNGRCEMIQHLTVQIWMHLVGITVGAFYWAIFVIPTIEKAIDETMFTNFCRSETGALDT